ncbi:hypothetical protein ACH5RR_025484 [Cinchona calisaya]|uniref:Syntaxin N-terminal domain-containing protein n=1 Tax=Cinchona calisaya TaxID=153742 RepID=A0ABD2Z2Y8_9GENT
MASSNSDQAEGGDFYVAAPYKARFSLQIDDLEKGQLNPGVTDLRQQVRQLRNASQETEAEGKCRKNSFNPLQKTFIKAQAGLKNNMKRLNLSIVRGGSNHVKRVVFGLQLLPGEKGGWFLGKTAVEQERLGVGFGVESAD